MQIRAWDDMLLLLLFVAHGLPLIAFWLVCVFFLFCVSLSLGRVFALWFRELFFGEGVCITGRQKLGVSKLFLC